MKAKELRKGNLVDYRAAGNTIAIEATDILEGEIKDIRVWSMIYKPIPLTEEWLVKFGFERGSLDMFRVYYHNGKVGFSWERHGQYLAFPFTYYCASLPENSSPVKLLYVHQLQNLYFALTGEELTIK